jgi:DNA-binding NarL/FixJ family response regulator
VSDERPIRLLLVEDNEVYRESLVFLLGRTADLEVVGAVGDGAAAIRATRDLDPDVVVLDFRLPDVSGREVASDLRGAGTRAGLVFLSASAEAEGYHAASDAGAPLVRKDAGLDALVEAVRRVAGAE